MEQEDSKTENREEDTRIEGIGLLTAYCANISENCVHCKRYKDFPIKGDQTPKDVIEKSN